MMSLVSGSVGGGSGAGPHPATANAANETRAQSASSDLHADRDEGTGCAIEDVRFVVADDYKHALRVGFPAKDAVRDRGYNAASALRAPDQRRVAPHCMVVNLVRSGRKQPQRIHASAGITARHLCLSVLSA